MRLYEMRIITGAFAAAHHVVQNQYLTGRTFERSNLDRARPQLRDQLLHVVGERRFEPHALALDGMVETQTPCVKSLTFEGDGTKLVRAVGVSHLADER